MLCCPIRSPLNCSSRLPGWDAQVLQPRRHRKLGELSKRRPFDVDPTANPLALVEQSSVCAAERVDGHAQCYFLALITSNRNSVDPSRRCCGMTPSRYARWRGAKPSKCWRGESWLASGRNWYANASRTTSLASRAPLETPTPETFALHSLEWQLLDALVIPPPIFRGTGK